MYVTPHGRQVLLHEEKAEADLGDFQQVDILVDSHITQLLAGAQLASNLMQVLCQVSFHVLHSALCIIILLVHSLYEHESCWERLVCLLPRQELL